MLTRAAVVAVLGLTFASAPAMPSWSLNARHRKGDGGGATGPATRANTAGNVAAAAALAGHRRQLQASAVQPLTVAEKASFAHAHNAERCALGQASLAWDDADATAAAALAATCSYASSTYQGLSNGGRGESLYATSFHQPSSQAVVAAVAAFLAEGAAWDCATNSCGGSVGSPMSCAHYTQAVWGTTTTLGCAVAHCSAGSPFLDSGDAWTLVACEYSPSGNTLTGTTADRPFDAASCTSASTCVGGVSADAATIESAITADAGAASTSACVSAADTSSRIDVLVLYTAEAVAAAGNVVALQLMVQAGIDEANEVLANSEVTLTFDVTAIELVSSTLSQADMANGEGLLQALTMNLDVKARRDLWKSDLVTLVTERSDFEETISWILGSELGEPDHGYSVIQTRALKGLAQNTARQFKLARTLGHTLGCASDASDAGYSSTPPVTAYGYGLRQTSAEPYFRTVMASGYNCPVGDGDGCLPLPYYSRHLRVAATCAETAQVSVSADDTNCSAVSIDPANTAFSVFIDTTACSTVMTANNSNISACTYTAAVAWNHTFEEANVTLLLGSATADCARTIEEMQTVVANYRIGDDGSCGAGSTGVLTLTGIPALPPRDCKNQCSFHGSCDYAAMVCRCRLPWSGDDCSERTCPDGCTGRGSCDTNSGVCKCNGGWTGVTCSIRVENFCTNDCAGTAGGSCDTSTGHCFCTRTYNLQDSTDSSSEMSLCTSAEGECWEGSDYSKVTSAPRVEYSIGEIGTVSTSNARDEVISGRQGGVEDGWQTVSLAKSYGTPVVFVSVPTDNEATPAIARVRNLRHDTSDAACDGWCFETRLQELECGDDDIHLVEQIDYMVLEAGSWQSWENSNRVFAGAFETDSAASSPTNYPVAYDINNLSVANPGPTLIVSAGAGGWVDLIWPVGMAYTPVVLSQVQTYEDTRAVSTRQKEVTTSGVQIRLQADSSGVHEEEVIGVLVFSTHAVGRFNRRRFDAGTFVAGSAAASEIVFRQDFGSRPRLFAALQTTVSGDAAQLRMMTVSEMMAQAREGDGGATGLGSPRLHDLTPDRDSRVVTGDYHSSIPATVTPASMTAQLTQREARRAWAYLQPRSGTVCNSEVKPCGGDGWGRGLVARGLRPCGGGMCVDGSSAICDGPTVGTCIETAPVSVQTDADACTAVSALDDDTACSAVVTAADSNIMACTYSHAMQLGADCEAGFGAGGGLQADCAAGCTYAAATGSCPTDMPADETVGYVAFDVGTTGAGILQGYSVLLTSPGIDGDCGVYAGPDICNGRGTMTQQEDRSDCVCDDGYFGSACEYTYCPRDCSGRGKCQHTTGTCVCSDRYHGDGCQYIHCPGDCNGRGSCDATTGVCTCGASFHAPACAAGACTPSCTNGGTCDETLGRCKCAPLFFGEACEIDASPTAAAEACAGAATDAVATPDCAAAFATAGGTGAVNCAAGCTYSGSDGTRGHSVKVGR